MLKFLLKTNSVFIWSALLLVADRFIKNIAIKGPLYERPFFGNSFPRLTLHQNYGLVFDINLSSLLIIIFSVAIIIFLIFIFIKQKNNILLRSGLILIIVGAASNLFDRIKYGFVIDTIEIFPGSIWNIADIMIVAGVLLIVIKWEKKL